MNQRGRIAVDNYIVANGNGKIILWESGEDTHGFCRLRLLSEFNRFPLNLGLVHELRVTTDSIDAKQYIGKKLIKMAEFLAWRNGYDGVAVIADAQSYYSRLGYVPENGFMIKRWHKASNRTFLDFAFIILASVAIVVCIVTSLLLEFRK
jgi:histone acetyltransferase (RNA polymerase elongator complex component)